MSWKANLWQSCFQTFFFLLWRRDGDLAQLLSGLQPGRSGRQTSHRKPTQLHWRPWSTWAVEEGDTHVHSGTHWHTVFLFLLSGWHWNPNIRYILLTLIYDISWDIWNVETPGISQVGHVFFFHNLGDKGESIQDYWPLRRSRCQDQKGQHWWSSLRLGHWTLGNIPRSPDLNLWGPKTGLCQLCLCGRMIGTCAISSTSSMRKIILENLI